MTVRQLGGALGALGGLVWILRWVVSPGDGAADLMRWAGLALVLLGLVCIGLTLVKGSALWLDAIVGFAAPALFWAVYEVLRGELGNAFILHGVLGVVCLLVGALTWVRGRLVYDEYEDDHEDEVHV
ncbi:hypothetical protein [Nocardioides jishulii]|uniref:SPW repeat-containing protein n=1 Tax=Nocardioides jishulii TaxID=2575440 RepID=A0A4U2YHC4_9ACTN|nr:hypothetical protein [Nocardioides jishulii]QCX26584.1 hypothetical protein FCL41_02760 [Nocardioides jishulii]TKI60447.1 hypothetical protein FC770_16790 [Nocardioides jishulii]